MVRIIASMRLQTVFTIFSVSLVLMITESVGILGCSGLFASVYAEKSPETYEDPFQAPRLLGCDSEDVIPGKYMVLLKHGYSLEQHMDTIGRGLNSSVDWVADATSSFGDGYYVATFDKATLAAVLEDFGVNIVECDAYIKFLDAEL